MYEELVNKMTELGYNGHMIKVAKERITELDKSGAKGLDKFVQKLMDRLSDKEAYLDILMEGRFAIILARNNFSNIYIEYNSEGPDLKANWNGNTIYFEVTRKHPKEDEWVNNTEAKSIRPVPINTTVAKITCKIPQLVADEINIVVVWSDTIELGTHEFKEATEQLTELIKSSSDECKNLTGVLFTEGGGIDTSTLKQFYFFKNDYAFKKIGIRLAKKLDSLHERDIKIVQKEMEELYKAMQRLKLSNKSPSPAKTVKIPLVFPLFQSGKGI
jgi:hypothetical protein